jgi:hypothetical protein
MSEIRRDMNIRKYVGFAARQRRSVLIDLFDQRL